MALFPKYNSFFSETSIRIKSQQHRCAACDSLDHQIGIDAPQAPRSSDFFALWSFYVSLTYGQSRCFIGK